MTRDEAISLAKTHAQRHVTDHAYLTDSDCSDWMPHEWVIEAVMAAASQAANEPNARLLELADRIDYGALWRRPGLERETMTQEQRDRLDAGVMLRRYADLLGNDGWRIYPPRPGISFRAGTLNKAVEMAKRDEDRRAES